MDHLLDVLPYATQTQDEAHARVYGCVTGTVTDVDTKLTQVKARLGKQGDNESTHWLIPMAMGSIESLPEVGDSVGVVFVDGDPHRGAYFCFPQSMTKGRPTESMVLGSTFVGMFNYLVTQFNQLRSDMAGHTHVIPSLTCSAPGTTTASVTGSKTSSAIAANKGKASDGSVVPDKSTSEVVHSKRSLVR